MANKGKGVTAEPTPPTGDVWVQLATRIPKDLHRAVKLHSVQRGESVMAFVIRSMTATLAADTEAAKPAKGRR